MIHLDTSYLVRALVGGSAQDQTLRGWLGGREALGISTIAWSEFLCGPVEPRQVELASAVIPHRIPFTEQDARLAASLFNESGRRRGSLMDCMVAAAAVNAKAPLATVNTKDFSRFERAGLVLVVS